MGQLGLDWFTDTALHQGSWAVITALSTATFGTLVNRAGAPTAVGGAAPSTDLGGLVLPAGVSLYGQFEEITLISGAIVAYRHQG